MHNVGGRPRADWDEDPAIVRAWCVWAKGHGFLPLPRRQGRFTMRTIHDWLTARHPRDYFRFEKGENGEWEIGDRDLVTWTDGQDWLAHVKALPLARKTQGNLWQPMYRFFQWRANAVPTSKRYAEELELVERLGTRNSKGNLVFFARQHRKPEGKLPYTVEQLRMIFEAADSYKVVTSTVPFTGATPDGHAVEYPSEDGIFVRLLTYTGGRAQFYGLLWRQIPWERHVIDTSTKGSREKKIGIASVAPEWDAMGGLENALHALRTMDPERRPVFRWGRYPYNDEEPWGKQGTCEHCGIDRDELFVYSFRDHDGPLCGACIDREVELAGHSNGNHVARTLHRVEVALHALHPDYRERVRDRKTGEFAEVLFHLTAHRFRKALVTIGKSAGMSRDDVKLITGHDSDAMVDEVYNMPSDEDKAAAANEYASGALAGKGRASELDALRQENDSLRSQVGDLTSRITKMGEQLTEILTRLPKNGGA